MNSPITHQPSQPGTSRQIFASPRARSRGWWLAILCAVPLISCGSDKPVGIVGHVEGFAGIVVADEPRAAMIGHDILSAGGKPADAAVATALALAVTLPSQAGLGAGGVCMVYDHQGQTIETIDFAPKGPATPIPALTRGLYLLYAKYGGGLFWDGLVAPAERVAREGHPVSRALASHLANWPSGALDPATKAVFFHADGHVLQEGEQLWQPALGATLGKIKAYRAAALYGGLESDQLAAAYNLTAGAALTADALRAYLPQWRPAGKLPGAGDNVYLPFDAQANGGERNLLNQVNAQPGEHASAPAKLATILALYRQRKPAAQTAATGFVVMGKDGTAIACDLSLGRMFGSGHLLAEAGFFPASGPLPEMQPVIAIDAASHNFRLALAAPPAGDSLSTAQGMAAIACGAGGDYSACTAATDPLGYGFVSRIGGE